MLNIKFAIGMWEGFLKPSWVQGSGLLKAGFSVGFQ